MVGQRDGSYSASGDMGGRQQVRQSYLPGQTHARPSTIIFFTIVVVGLVTAISINSPMSLHQVNNLFILTTIQAETYPFCHILKIPACYFMSLIMPTAILADGHIVLPGI